MLPPRDGLRSEDCDSPAAPQVGPGEPPDPDGGDMSCSDLLSLRSDSRRSEDDDTRSVTTSSVMSLFPRQQLDPLEKAWWRSSALGLIVAQRQLLAQEPALVLKKVKIRQTNQRAEILYPW
ncbi:putative ankyrin repeat domain-containing protein SOWAHC-like [Scophthalmus maximus]|uniref:Putative ankyrin repeat domain-containing protein SOWAHC-like n=1 Tax=Scophthalmus maximus TaxID=52904 RepID=A0A2U9BXQ8_SCOMX|nr:putative ankyrin repeat domain-containing protein SOWAHC-like [Scophthalmus maximus]